MHLALLFVLGSALSSCIDEFQALKQRLNENLNDLGRIKDIIMQIEGVRQENNYQFSKCYA